MAQSDTKPVTNLSGHDSERDFYHRKRRGCDLHCRAAGPGSRPPCLHLKPGLGWNPGNVGGNAAHINRKSQINVNANVENMKCLDSVVQAGLRGRPSHLLRQCKRFSPALPSISTLLKSLRSFFILSTYTDILGFSVRKTYATKK